MPEKRRKHIPLRKCIACQERKAKRELVRVVCTSEGTIEIAGERYLLVRASALSYGFLSAIRELYDDRGDVEALHIGKTLLFDMAHVIGINDARNFHEKMGLTELSDVTISTIRLSKPSNGFTKIINQIRRTNDSRFQFRQLRKERRKTAKEKVKHLSGVYASVFAHARHISKEDAKEVSGLEDHEFDHAYKQGFGDCRERHAA